MFWETVLGGFSLLSHWQVWVGILFNSIMTAVVFFIIRFCHSRTNSFVSFFTPFALMGIGSYLDAIILTK